MRRTGQGGHPEAPNSAPLGYVFSLEALPPRKKLLTSLSISNRLTSAGFYSIYAPQRHAAPSPRSALSVIFIEGPFSLKKVNSGVDMGLARINPNSPALDSKVTYLSKLALKLLFFDRVKISAPCAPSSKETPCSREISASLVRDLIARGRHVCSSRPIKLTSFHQPILRRIRNSKRTTFIYISYSTGIRRSTMGTSPENEEVVMKNTERIFINPMGWPIPIQG